jgi:hypothetical protein
MSFSEVPLLMTTKMGLSDSFLSDLGHFFGLWAALEATIDYMIGSLLKISHEETHILTAGMEFGRKADLLRAFLARSSHKEKDRIGPLLTIIQNEARRNIFTHSMISSNADLVTFTHRKVQGAYSTTEITFTGPEFNRHVCTITRYMMDLHSLLDIDENDFQAFGKAASSASTKANRSPHPPSSSA